MRPARFVSANDYIMFQTSDQCHQVATQSFALKRWKARGPILGRYSLHTHSFLNRKEGTHLVLSYVGKSFLVQNIERKSYSSLAVKFRIPEGRGIVVVWYIVIWIVLYLTSVFDLILGFLGFVSMNDTDIPWTGDLSCQVSKIPLACLLICSVCWRGKTQGVQAWEDIFSPYSFLSEQGAIYWA